MRGVFLACQRLKHTKLRQNALNGANPVALSVAKLSPHIFWVVGQQSGSVLFEKRPGYLQADLGNVQRALQLK